ncbi:MAG: cytochrome c [Alphaproteobacteria bacterium]|nr:cytochrome c [Alphaproteobacteria bacterium]
MWRDQRRTVIALNASEPMTEAASSARQPTAEARPVLLKRAILVSFCAAFAVYSIYVWTAGTDLPRSHALDPQVAAGFALYQDKNCVACHQFYGLGGHMGPDLTNVISTPDKGADYARAFIESGTGKMPDYGFDEADVDALVRFLEFVDSAGTYPPRRPELNWDGTVAYDTSRDTR